MRCRHRVLKLLLLHGRVYPEPSIWTQAHRRWLARERNSRRSCSASRSATGPASRVRPSSLAGSGSALPSTSRARAGCRARSRRRAPAMSPPARRGGPAPPGRAADRGYARQPPAEPASARDPDPLARSTGSTDCRSGCAAAVSPGNIATVAVARELACFLWAAAVAPRLDRARRRRKAGQWGTNPVGSDCSLRA